MPSRTYARSSFSVHLRIANRSGARCARVCRGCGCQERQQSGQRRSDHGAPPAARAPAHPHARAAACMHATTRTCQVLHLLALLGVRPELDLAQAAAGGHSWWCCTRGGRHQQQQRPLTGLCATAALQAQAVCVSRAYWLLLRCRAVQLSLWPPATCAGAAAVCHHPPTTAFTSCGPSWCLCCCCEAPDQRANWFKNLSLR
jgi:hypothetical protein